MKYVISAIAIFLANVGAFALPQGGRIEKGLGNLDNPAHIIQESQHLQTRWNSFDIGAKEQVRIEQPNAQSSINIKVRNGAATNINGTLTANGRVSLENPAGIQFGKNSVVNVGGLLASSAKGAITGLGQVSAAEVVRFQGLSSKSVVNVGGDVAAQEIIVESNGDIVIGNSANFTASQQVLIGGGLQGKDSNVLNARTTDVKAAAQINAPRVIVWSDKVTRFLGRINAGRGFVEVSGKQHLIFPDISRVTAGKLLLDPADITIYSGGQSRDDEVAGDGILRADEFAGTSFNLGAPAIQNYAGDVSVAASGTLTVNFFTPINKSNGSLTLSARNFEIFSAVTISGAGHYLSIELTGTSASTPFDFGSDGAIIAGDVRLAINYTDNTEFVFSTAITDFFAAAGRTVTIEAPANIGAALNNGFNLCAAGNTGCGDLTVSVGTLSLGGTFAADDINLTVAAGAITFNSTPTITANSIALTQVGAWGGTTPPSTFSTRPTLNSSSNFIGPLWGVCGTNCTAPPLAPADLVITDGNLDAALVGKFEVSGTTLDLGDFDLTADTRFLLIPPIITTITTTGTISITGGLTATAAGLDLTAGGGLTVGGNWDLAFNALALTTGTGAIAFNSGSDITADSIMLTQVDAYGATAPANFSPAPTLNSSTPFTRPSWGVCGTNCTVSTVLTPADVIVVDGNLETALTNKFAIPSNGMLDLGSFNLTASGTTALTIPSTILSITTTGTISITGGLTATAALNLTAGTVALGGTFTAGAGAETLTLTSANPITASSALTISSPLALSAASLGSAGFDLTLAGVTRSGGIALLGANITLNGAVTIAGNATLVANSFTMNENLAAWRVSFELTGVAPAAAFTFGASGGFTTNNLSIARDYTDDAYVEISSVFAAPGRRVEITSTDIAGSTSSGFTTTGRIVFPDGFNLCQADNTGCGDLILNVDAITFTNTTNTIRAKSIDIDINTNVFEGIVSENGPLELHAHDGSVSVAASGASTGFFSNSGQDVSLSASKNVVLSATVNRIGTGTMTVTAGVGIAPKGIVDIGATEFVTLGALVLSQDGGFFGTTSLLTLAGNGISGGIPVTAIYRGAGTNPPITWATLVRDPDIEIVADLMVSDGDLTTALFGKFDLSTGSTLDLGDFNFTADTVPLRVPSSIRTIRTTGTISITGGLTATAALTLNAGAVLTIGGIWGLGTHALALTVGAGAIDFNSGSDITAGSIALTQVADYGVSAPTTFSTPPTLDRPTSFTRPLWGVCGTNANCIVPLMPVDVMVTDGNLMGALFGKFAIPSNGMLDLGDFDLTATGSTALDIPSTILSITTTGTISIMGGLTAAAALHLSAGTMALGGTFTAGSNTLTLTSANAITANSALVISSPLIMAAPSLGLAGFDLTLAGVTSSTALALLGATLTLNDAVDVGGNALTLTAAAAGDITFNNNPTITAGSIALTQVDVFSRTAPAADFGGVRPSITRTGGAQRGVPWATGGFISPGGIEVNADANDIILADEIAGYFEVDANGVLDFGRYEMAFGTESDMILPAGLTSIIISAAFSFSVGGTVRGGGNDLTISSSEFSLSGSPSFTATSVTLSAPNGLLIGGGVVVTAQNLTIDGGTGRSSFSNPLTFIATGNLTLLGIIGSSSRGIALSYGGTLSGTPTLRTNALNVTYTGTGSTTLPSSIFGAYSMTLTGMPEIDIATDTIWTADSITFAGNTNITGAGTLTLNVPVIDAGSNNLTINLPTVTFGDNTAITADNIDLTASAGAIGFGSNSTVTATTGIDMFQTETYTQATPAAFTPAPRLAFPTTFILPSWGACVVGCSVPTDINETRTADTDLADLIMNLFALENGILNFSDFDISIRVTGGTLTLPNDLTEITGTGSITIIADDIASAGGQNDLSIRVMGNTLTLGGNFNYHNLTLEVGTLNLSAANRLGTDQSGVVAAVVLNYGTLQGAPSLSSQVSSVAITTTNTGTFTLSTSATPWLIASGLAITLNMGGAIALAGAIDFAAGNVDLTAGGGSGITLAGTTALTAGTLNLTASSGNIELAGALTLTGQANINAGGSGEIIFTNNPTLSAGGGITLSQGSTNEYPKAAPATFTGTVTIDGNHNRVSWAVGGGALIVGDITATGRTDDIIFADEMAAYYTIDVNGVLEGVSSLSLAGIGNIVLETTGDIILPNNLVQMAGDGGSLTLKAGGEVRFAGTPQITRLLLSMRGLTLEGAFNFPGNLTLLSSRAVNFGTGRATTISAAFIQIASSNDATPSGQDLTISSGGGITLSAGTKGQQVKVIDTGVGALRLEASSSGGSSGILINSNSVAGASVLIAGASITLQQTNTVFTRSPHGISFSTRPTIEYVGAGGQRLVSWADGGQIIAGNIDVSGRSGDITLANALFGYFEIGANNVLDLGGHNLTLGTTANLILPPNLVEIRTNGTLNLSIGGTIQGSGSQFALVADTLILASTPDFGATALSLRATNIFALPAATTISANTITLNAASTSTSTANPLTLTATTGSLTLGGVLTLGTNALTLNFATTLEENSTAPLTLTASSVTVARTGAGSITLPDWLFDDARALTLTVPTINLPAAATWAATSITFTTATTISGAGALTLSATTITAGSNDLSIAVDSLSFGATSTIEAQNISLTSSTAGADNAFNLTLTATNDITLAGHVNVGSGDVAITATGGAITFTSNPTITAATITLAQNASFADDKPAEFSVVPVATRSGIAPNTAYVISGWANCPSGDTFCGAPQNISFIDQTTDLDLTVIIGGKFSLTDGGATLDLLGSALELATTAKIILPVGLTTITTSGSITLVAGSIITAGGTAIGAALTINANALTLGGTLNAGSNNLILQATAGALSFATATTINGGNITLGGVAAPALSTTNPTLSVEASGSLTITGFVNVGTGTIALSAGSGAIVFTGADLTANTITLTQADPYAQTRPAVFSVVPALNAGSGSGNFNIASWGVCGADPQCFTPVDIDFSGANETLADIIAGKFFIVGGVLDLGSFSLSINISGALTLPSGLTQIVTDSNNITLVANTFSAPDANLTIETTTSGNITLQGSYGVPTYNLTLNSAGALNFGTGAATSLTADIITLTSADPATASGQKLSLLARDNIVFDVDIKVAELALEASNGFSGTPTITTPSLTYNYTGSANLALAGSPWIFAAGRNVTIRTTDSGANITLFVAGSDDDTISLCDGLGANCGNLTIDAAGGIGLVASTQAGVGIGTLSANNITLNATSIGSDSTDINRNLTLQATGNLIINTPVLALRNTRGAALTFDVTGSTTFSQDITLDAAALSGLGGDITAQSLTLSSADSTTGSIAFSTTRATNITATGAISFEFESAPAAPSGQDLSLDATGGDITFAGELNIGSGGLEVVTDQNLVFTLSPTITTAEVFLTWAGNASFPTAPATFTSDGTTIITPFITAANQAPATWFQLAGFSLDAGSADIDFTTGVDLTRGTESLTFSVVAGILDFGTDIIRLTTLGNIILPASIREIRADNLTIDAARMGSGSQASPFASALTITATDDLDLTTTMIAMNSGIALNINFADALEGAPTLTATNLGITFTGTGAVTLPSWVFGDARQLRLSVAEITLAGNTTWVAGRITFETNTTITGTNEFSLHVPTLTAGANTLTINAGQLSFLPTAASTITGGTVSLTSTTAPSTGSNQALNITANNNLTLAGSFNVGSGAMTLTSTSAVIAFTSTPTLTAASFSLTQNGAVFAETKPAPFQNAAGADVRPTINYTGTGVQQRTRSWADGGQAIGENIDLSGQSGDINLADIIVGFFEIGSNNVLDLSAFNLTLGTTANLIVPSNLVEIRTSGTLDLDVGGFQGMGSQFALAAGTLNLAGALNFGATALSLRATTALILSAAHTISADSIELSAGTASTTNGNALTLTAASGSITLGGVLDLGANALTLNFGADLEDGSTALTLTASSVTLVRTGTGAATLSGGVFNGGTARPLTLTVPEINIPAAATWRATSITFTRSTTITTTAALTLNAPTITAGGFDLSINVASLSFGATSTIEARNISLTSSAAGTTNAFNLTLTAANDITLAGHVNVGSGALTATATSGGIAFTNNPTITAATITLLQSDTFTRDEPANFSVKPVATRLAVGAVYEVPTWADCSTPPANCRAPQSISETSSTNIDLMTVITGKFSISGTTLDLLSSDLELRAGGNIILPAGLTTITTSGNITFVAASIVTDGGTAIGDNLTINANTLTLSGTINAGSNNLNLEATTGSLSFEGATTISGGNITLGGAIAPATTTNPALSVVASGTLTVTGIVNVGTGSIALTASSTTAGSDVIVFTAANLTAASIDLMQAGAYAAATPATFSVQPALIRTDSANANFNTPSWGVCGADPQCFAPVDIDFSGTNAMLADIIDGKFSIVSGVLDLGSSSLSINISGALTLPAGLTSIRTAGGNITLIANTFTNPQAVLTIETTTSGDITFQGTYDTGRSYSLKLLSAGALNFGTGAETSITAGTLTFSSGAAATASGQKLSLFANSFTSFDGVDINVAELVLDTPGFFIGTPTITTPDLTLNYTGTDAGSATYAGSHWAFAAGRNVTIRTTNSSVNMTLFAANAATDTINLCAADGTNCGNLTLESATEIRLSNSTQTSASLGTISANNITITATAIGSSSNINRNLILNIAGDLTIDTPTLTLRNTLGAALTFDVAGTTTFTQDITLDVETISGLGGTIEAQALTLSSGGSTTGSIAFSTTRATTITATGAISFEFENAPTTPSGQNLTLEATGGDITFAGELNIGSGTLEVVTDQNVAFTSNPTITAAEVFLTWAGNANFATAPAKFTDDGTNIITPFIEAANQADATWFQLAGFSLNAGSADINLTTGVTLSRGAETMAFSVSADGVLDFGTNIIRLTTTGNILLPAGIREIRARNLTINAATMGSGATAAPFASALTIITTDDLELNTALAMASGVALNLSFANTLEGALTLTATNLGLAFTGAGAVTLPSWVFDDATRGLRLNIADITFTGNTTWAAESITFETNTTITSADQLSLNVPTLNAGANTLTIDVARLNFLRTSATTITGGAISLTATTVSSTGSDQALTITATNNLTLAGSFNIGSGAMVLTATQGVIVFSSTPTLTALAFSLTQGGAAFAAIKPATFIDEALANVRPTIRYTTGVQLPVDWDVKTFLEGLSETAGGGFDISILTSAGGALEVFETSPGILDFGNADLILGTDDNITIPDRITEIRGRNIIIRATMFGRGSTAAANPLNRNFQFVATDNIVFMADIQSDSRITFSGRSITFNDKKTTKISGSEIFITTTGVGLANNQNVFLEATGNITLDANLNLGVGSLVINADNIIVTTDATTITAYTISYNAATIRSSANNVSLTAYDNIYLLGTSLNNRDAAVSLTAGGSIVTRGAFDITGSAVHFEQGQARYQAGRLLLHALTGGLTIVGPIAREMITLRVSRPDQLDRTNAVIEGAVTIEVSP